MWNGGVRVILPDEEGRILMVCQRHEDKDIWMVPGGAIENGEDAMAAAVREMLEETGLAVEIGDLIWHVEEVSETRGQRFVNFFLAKMISGEAVLGKDPEFPDDRQVLKDLRFFTMEEIRKLPFVYPQFLRDELWDVLKGQKSQTFKIR